MSKEFSNHLRLLIVTTTLCTACAEQPPQTIQSPNNRVNVTFRKIPYTIDWSKGQNCDSLLIDQIEIDNTPGDIRAVTVRSTNPWGVSQLDRSADVISQSHSTLVDTQPIAFNTPGRHKIRISTWNKRADSVDSQTFVTDINCQPKWINNWQTTIFDWFRRI